MSLPTPITEGGAEAERASFNPTSNVQSEEKLPVLAATFPSPDELSASIELLQRTIALKLDRLVTAIEELTLRVNDLQQTNTTQQQQPERQEQCKQQPQPQQHLSRLQKMSKASAKSEEDLEIERRKSSARKEKSPNATGNIASSNNARLQQMSLAQRKREFAMKTAPGTGHGRERGERKKPDRAVAAARKALERERAQRDHATKLEREQANSIGSWLLVVLLVLLGGTAVLLGGVGFAKTKQAARLKLDSQNEL